nr:glycosyltransferase [Candidatus Aenigmarchaeota archaeon]
GSEDSFGRTIWALGYTVGQKGIDLEFKKRTNKILKKSLDLTLSLSSPRAKAFSLIGLWWLKDKKRTRVLANSLVSLYKENQTRNWKWFEENLTYSNAILPLSLFLAYNLTKDKKYLEVAKESFDFLLKICRHKGVVSAIGQAGWYKNKGTKALFDQQPVDPANMVLASTQAYKTTKNKRYLKEAYDWFSWFYGENIGRRKVVDKKTGAVFDGLTKDGVNINQGAESTVSYLLAHLSLTELF